MRLLSNSLLPKNRYAFGIQATWAKVVVEFSPKDMPLDEAQQQKLRKLLGARWNPETDIAKMSCEQFEHQAQNKRYLGDLVNKLVAQAKVCLHISIFLYIHIHVPVTSLFQKLTD